jgi:ABC-type sulfate transport system permease subunit
MNILDSSFVEEAKTAGGVLLLLAIPFSAAVAIVFSGLGCIWVLNQVYTLFNMGDATNFSLSFALGGIILLVMAIPMVIIYGVILIWTIKNAMFSPTQ